MTLPRNLGTLATNVDTSGKLNVTGIKATGTPSSSTVLKGDGTWGSVSGSAGPTGPTGSVGPTGPQGPSASFNYFGSVQVGATTISPDFPNQVLNFAAGDNVTLTGDNSTKTITISSTGGGGNSLTWVSNSGPSDPITITGVTGITGVSGQSVWVAIASDGTSSINNVTVGGNYLNFIGSNGSGLQFYAASTDVISTNGDISITFMGGPSNIAMATYWVTTTNVINSQNVSGTQVSDPSFYGQQNSSYPFGNKLFVSSTQVNMTTAMATPSGWTSLGSATHTSYTSLTVIAFEGPETWGFTEFMVTNGGMSYNFAVAANS